MNDGKIMLDQSASALFGIRSIVGLIPGGAMLIGAVIMAFFPIKGQRLVDLKGRIMVMHAEKKAAMEWMEAENAPKSEAA
jgi:Na+/melibiose symporter-like transporter